MSKLQNIANQGTRYPLYRADGTVGSSAKLVLPRAVSRSYLFIQNISAHTLNFEIGCGAATATLTGSVVTSVSVTNAGFNYTHPPLVRFLGGGVPGGNSSWVGIGQPDMPAPSRPAQGHAVLTSNAISSIVVDDPGAGYVTAPYVEIINSDIDFAGAALPSATTGFQLATGAPPLIWDGIACPTDPVSVIGANTADAFTCRWMD